MDTCYFEHNPLNPFTVKTVGDVRFDRGAILLNRFIVTGQAVLGNAVGRVDGSGPRRWTTPEDDGLRPE